MCRTGESTEGKSGGIFSSQAFSWEPRRPPKLATSLGMVASTVVCRTTGSPSGLSPPSISSAGGTQPGGGAGCNLPLLPLLGGTAPVGLREPS
eukprot:1315755-Heterocapsa_arctica.AAC.1